MILDASLLFRLILELESHVGIALAGHGINLPIDFFSRSVLEMHTELLIDQSGCTKDFFKLLSMIEAGQTQEARIYIGFPFPLHSK